MSTRKPLSVPVRRRALLLLALLGGASASALPALAAQPPAQAPPSLGAIFEQLARMKGFEADFVEDKYLALLKAPLTSSGKLYYLAPGRLVRLVEHPEKMKISVVDGKVRIEDASGQRDVDLSNRPGVAAFVTAFSHFLDGNRKELAAHFRLDYQRDDDGGWTLTMVPRREPLTHVVARMEMSGRGPSIDRLVVEETNGDRSVTRLSAVDTHRSYSAEEKKRIFGR